MQTIEIFGPAEDQFGSCGALVTERTYVYGYDDLVDEAISQGWIQEPGTYVMRFPEGNYVHFFKVKKPKVPKLERDTF